MEPALHGAHFVTSYVHQGVLVIEVQEFLSANRALRGNRVFRESCV